MILFRRLAGPSLRTRAPRFVPAPRPPVVPAKPLRPRTVSRAAALPLSGLAARMILFRRLAGPSLRTRAPRFVPAPRPPVVPAKPLRPRAVSRAAALPLSGLAARIVLLRRLAGPSLRTRAPRFVPAPRSPVVPAKPLRPRTVSRATALPLSRRSSRMMLFRRLAGLAAPLTARRARHPFPDTVVPRDGGGR